MQPERIVKGECKIFYKQDCVLSLNNSRDLKTDYYPIRLDKNSFCSYENKNFTLKAPLNLFLNHAYIDGTIHIAINII